MPVEKLRDLDDDPVSTTQNGQTTTSSSADRHNGENGVGVSASSSSPMKNGSLHKSGSKLGFSKKKAANSNGDANGVSGSGKRAGKSHDVDTDPFRFSGDGVDFKAKLIGVREVSDARGDQMCQDAMQMCKALVKSSGQHKKRIYFNVSLDGLKIKEQSSGNIIHSFPVGKVSFIAKDVSDNRAFGFVYGSPEERHKFFAIKTEKTSDQVVMSIRDMFHVVYEMKKKQMEVAKQNKDTEIEVEQKASVSETRVENDVVVADLLDLECELQNLQEGVQHMNSAWDDFNPRADEGIPRNASSSASFTNGSHSSDITLMPSFAHTVAGSALNDSLTDPFGADSFNSTPNSQNSPPITFFAAAVPPPPPSASRRRSSNSQPGLLDATTTSVPMTHGSGSNPFLQQHQQMPMTNLDNFTPKMDKNFGSFNSMPGSVDPFDTSRFANAGRLSNRRDPTSQMATSTPLPGFAAPFYISGSQSNITPFEANRPGNPTFDFVSPNGDNSVFGMTPTNGNASTNQNQSQLPSSNSCSTFNAAFCDSQSPNDGGKPRSLETSQMDETMKQRFSTSNLNGMNGSSHSVNGSSNGLNVGSQQGHVLLDTSILKTAKAGTIDEAFGVLCNLDGLTTTAINNNNNIHQQNHNHNINTNTNTNTSTITNNNNNNVVKEDLFAQMRPPPKKTMNELRGGNSSPPVSSSPSNALPISLANLDELYSSSPGSAKFSSSPAFGRTASPAAFLGGTSPSSAPPIPPRIGGVAPPPPVANGLLGENGRHRRPLPQPISAGNGGSMFGKGGDPFADDPFFA